MRKPRDWPKEFNSLPKEIRIIGSAMETITRIRQLEREKSRLGRWYLESLAGVNADIKRCTEALQELEDASRP